MQSERQAPQPRIRSWRHYCCGGFLRCEPTRTRPLVPRPLLCKIEFRGWGLTEHLIDVSKSLTEVPAMKVKNATHKGVDDWVSPDTPITELAKLMRNHDTGSIPIGENDRLIGMVTDRDIVCKGLAEDGFDASRAMARNVMTPGIHCCRGR